MFVKIQDDYINVDCIVDINVKNDTGCKIYFINGTSSTYENITPEDFMKEVEKQAMIPINRLVAKSTIQDRFKLMDLDK